MSKVVKFIITFLVLAALVAFGLFFYLNYKSDKELEKKNPSSQEINNNDDTSSDKNAADESSDASLDSDEGSEDSFSSNNNNDISSNNSSAIGGTIEKPNTGVEIVEGSSPRDPNYIYVTSISLTLRTTTLEIGESARISVLIKPSNATEKNIVCKSGNSKVAVVSSDGLITGVRVGTAYISVTVNDYYTKVIKVTVVDKNDTDSDKVYKNEVIIEYTNKVDNTTNESQDISNTNSSTNTNNNTNNSDDNNSNKTNDNNADNDSVEEVKKNGWYIENKKKYYYKDGKLVKDGYVEYIYLDKNGVAQEKIGDFSATLYGAIAWANQELNIREKATKNSKRLGGVPVGGKMIILSSENSSTRYIKIKYNNTIGYVFSDYIYINLPDIMPDMVYNITNADNSIFKAADVNIPNVTGKALYGYTKQYNSKIDKTTYYAPLLYPVSKQLQKAYNVARSQGYNIKVYDTYRPYDVAVSVYKEFSNLYNTNKQVYNTINYDKGGKYWGPTWFLTKGASGHNRGTDMDITLTDSNNKELSAQTPMHTLDARSVVKYNNNIANKLREIMTSVGFETLKSEWWHFQENNYRSSPINSFRLK